MIPAKRYQAFAYLTEEAARLHQNPVTAYSDLHFKTLFAKHKIRIIKKSAGSRPTKCKQPILLQLLLFRKNAPHIRLSC